MFGRRKDRPPYQVVYTDKVLRKARKKAGPGAKYLVTRCTIRRELDLLVAVGWEVVEHAAGQILGTTSSGTYTLRMAVDSPDNKLYEEKMAEREQVVDPQVTAYLEKVEFHTPMAHEIPSRPRRRAGTRHLMR